jgi:D-amino-acid dehydrogenase
MSEAVDVVVIGAGIVGACIAHALGARGDRVVLVDRDEPGHGASFGNSGALSPGSVAPLAMPGVLSGVPSMLLDARGPLYLPPEYLPRALPWLARFVAAARPPRWPASPRRWPTCTAARSTRTSRWPPPSAPRT